MNFRILRIALLTLLSVLTITSAEAASTVQGRIYLKDGRIIECGEKDRIRLPKHAQDVKLLRRAFYKDKSKEVYRYEEIDSMVCWHATAHEHRQKFIPAPGVGWLWVYFETPYICVGIFAQKGYGIDSNGGIEVLVKYRSLSRSRTAYYLRKAGEEEFYDAGSASRQGKGRFRESVAAYVADDVVSIDYVETTADHPDGVRWESHPLAKPNFASRHHTMQMLFCVDKVGTNATTYWWKIWVASGMNGMGRSLQTNYGVRFHNDPEGIVYPYMLVNSVLMKDRYPGLQDFCKKWFKGPEGKVHKKEAEENDAWILDMYDAYLEQMGDKAAELPYPIPGKKGGEE